jgi:hypothetical protein
MSFFFFRAGSPMPFGKAPLPGSPGHPGKATTDQKLDNGEMAWVLECDERTIRRRRAQCRETGCISKNNDVSMKAEKLRQHHVEVS